MMKKLTLLFITSIVCNLFTTHSGAQIITTIAGRLNPSTLAWSGDNIPATDAVLGTPSGLVIDTAGNIYFAELGHNTVRKINTAGIISTVAGNGIEGFSGDGGPATDAQLSYPFGLALDRAGNIYVADVHNGCVRKVSTSGIITTVAGQGGVWTGSSGNGGPATDAVIGTAYYIATDSQDNLYISDNGSTSIPKQIRKVDNAGIINAIAGGGTVVNLADGGQATDASISSLNGITTDIAGNIYALCDGYIKKISPSGVITSIAGGNHVSGLDYQGGDGGPATAATIGSCENINIDKDGNFYLCSQYPNIIRKINTAGIINTIAGGGTSFADGGDGGDAIYCTLASLATGVDRNGDLIISDYDNNCIRKISYTTAVKNIQEEGHGISVYPSHNHGSFTVDLTPLTATQATITIMDVNGKKIQEISTATNKPVQLNLQVSSGTYFVIANAAGQKWCRQIIIE